jgi:L-threonylcarbamoyladenylate synthase
METPLQNLLPTSALLLQARDRLLAGGVVAIPTETVYGLAASIASERGLRQVFALKNRPFFDPLIVHVASVQDARSLVQAWPPLADFLTSAFWPGPLTIVLPKSAHVHPLITAGLDTVAIRAPAHALTQSLLRLVDTPLAAPSANKFGRTSPSRPEHVAQEFCGEDVTEAMLQHALRQWVQPVSIVYANSTASPGHLKQHYMPAVPLVILREQEHERGAPLSATIRHRLTSALHLPADCTMCELPLNEVPALAARELYSDLHRLAASGASVLYVRASPERQHHDLWAAIWDRLQRAASLELTL